MNFFTKCKGIKGQSSLEYFTNYVWAIAAVTLVGITIWEMGFLSPQADVEPSIAGFAQIGPQKDDIWFTRNCDFFIRFYNYAGGKIVVTDGQATETISGTTYNNQELFIPKNVIQSGDIFFVEGSASGCSTPLKAGDNFHLELAIDYVTEKSEIPHTIKGTVDGIVYDGALPVEIPYKKSIVTTTITTTTTT